MTRAYREAVNFLEKYIPSPEKKHPGELGFQRMKYLVELLGNPQNSYPTIHVTGTSGKGSTATFIASILCEKYKVGLLTSPHLIKVNERIKIIKQCNNVTMKQLQDNNNDVSDKDFFELVRKIKPVVEKMEKSKYGAPSYFEIITAMAFMHFFKERVEIAVVEVGMGGRYDATNVIDPTVAVITNIGLDHTDILGNTIEKIAEDKAGIIKPGIKVVSGVSQSSVVQTIELACKRQGANLSLLDHDFSYQIKKISREGSAFDYFGEKTYRDLRIRMLGEHQIENATIAVRAIEQLNNFTMTQLNNKSIRNGLLAAFIPGRMEVIRKNPLVILDGAHNPDKMKALIRAIKNIYPRKKVTVILAIKNDKNAKGMITQILEIAHKVIFTQYQLISDTGMISSYDSTDLFEIAQRLDKKKEMEIDEDPVHTLKQTIKEAKKEDLILVTGSLYLIGEIKRNFQ